MGVSTRLLLNGIRRTALYCFAVIAPLAAFIVEYATGICAETFIDPIPSIWHRALVLAVGLINGFVLYRLAGRPKWLARSRRNPNIGNLVQEQVLQGVEAVGVKPPTKDESRSTYILAWLLGTSVGTCAVYSLVMGPIYPLAGGIIIFSVAALFLPVFLAILPFSPFLCLISTEVVFRRLKRHSKFAPKALRRLYLAGVGCSLLFIGALEAPRIVTRLYLTEEDSTQAAQISRIDFLRTFADEELILNLAYGMRGQKSDFFSWLNFEEFQLSPRYIYIDPARAQELYYKITGTPFNRVPRKAAHSPLFGWFGFDSSQGTQAIGELSPEVKLIASKIDSSLSTEELASYTEWTMAFRNSSHLQREARAMIRLPEGALVTRATLWIDGVEQEAAFGAAADVKSAYSKVVSARRDPLLVTWAGPNRIFVQCFPIQPQGEMRVKIGITAPLYPNRGSTIATTLPAIIEQNFIIDNNLEHAVWIESKSQLTSSSSFLAEERGNSSSVSALRGQIPATTALSNVRIQTERAVAEEVRSLFKEDSQSFVIKQTIESVVPKRKQQAVVVIDPSVKLKHTVGDLANALAALPSSLNLQIILAEEIPELLTTIPVSLQSKDFQAALESLRWHEFAGGHDNAPALAKALELADRHQAQIIWISGPQPLKVDEFNLAFQYLTRRPAQREMTVITLADGTNKLLERLSEKVAIREVLPDFGAERGISDLLSELLLSNSYPSIVRRASLADLDSPTSGGVDSSVSAHPHLNRLYAGEEILKLLAKGSKDSRARATTLGTTYRLVTPVTGAVVLETKQQYAEAGLEPSPVGTVPVIPEPEVYALVSIVLLGAALLAKRSKARMVPQ